MLKSLGSLDFTFLDFAVVHRCLITVMDKWAKCAFPRVVGGEQTQTQPQIHTMEETERERERERERETHRQRDMHVRVFICMFVFLDLVMCSCPPYPSYCSPFMTALRNGWQGRVELRHGGLAEAMPLDAGGTS